MSNNQIGAKGIGVQAKSFLGYVPPKGKDKNKRDIISIGTEGRPSTEQEAKMRADQKSALPETKLETRNDNRQVSKNEMPSILDSFALIRKPKASIIVRIQTKTFGTFQLDSKILPTKLQGIPNDAKNELWSQIEQKIEAGGKLCEKILKGAMEAKDAEKPTLKDISDLMWFLQAKAENLEEGGKKVGSFTSGALSIEDPDQYLVKYLDRCTEVYQRESSHIKEFQSLEGGVHRGIDFNPEGSELQGNPDYGQYLKDKEKYKDYLDNALPHDKRTVMIAPMLKYSNSKVADFPGNRVLIKMELYGFKTDSFKDRDRSEGPESRKSNKYDFEHKIGHAWEYLLSLWRTITGGQIKAGTRKERVPSDIQKDYKNLIKQYEALGKEDYVTILNKNNPLSTSGGIRVMIANIDNLKSSGVNVELLTALDALRKKIADKYPGDYHVRIGDEVCFSIDSLTK